MTLCRTNYAASGIRAKPSKVFEALTTIESLSHWWVSDSPGNAKTGGVTLFGLTDKELRKLTRNKFVEWKRIRGPKDQKDDRLFIK